jgi:hypothetical protein
MKDDDPLSRDEALLRALDWTVIYTVPYLDPPAPLWPLDSKRETWWEDLLFQPPPRITEESVCTGYGHCHGCLKWCEYCGDVSDMCDCDRCDAHGRYPEALPANPNQLALPFDVPSQTVRGTHTTVC